MQPGAHIQRERHRTLTLPRKPGEDLLLLQREGQAHVLGVEAYGVDADRGQLAPADLLA